MQLTSPAFQNGGKIPSKYACDGENVNPSLHISGVPANAISLALIMDDPDIPDFVKKSKGIQVWDHWVVFNLSPLTKEIQENSTPTEDVVGKNTGGKNSYGGPCPPDKEHRYFFKLYALDEKLALKESATKADVEKMMEGHILAKAVLIGKYGRKKL